MSKTEELIKKYTEQGIFIYYQLQEIRLGFENGLSESKTDCFLKNSLAITEITDQ